MTSQQAVELKEFLLPQLNQETKITERVLAAVPDDQAGYKPHDTCMSGRDLAQHLAFSDVWFFQSVLNGEFGKPDDAEALTLKPSEITALYREKIPALLEQLRALSGDHLARQVKFYVFDFPLVTYLQFAQKHAVHHRGQLSAYLRPMGAKVPSIYGGSADEPMTAGA